MIISTDVEKVFDEIQQSFMRKSLMKRGRAGTCYTITKAMYVKPKANGILSGEKSIVFPWKSEKSKKCACSPLLYKIAPEILVIVIRKKKEISKRCASSPLLYKIALKVLVTATRKGKEIKNSKSNYPYIQIIWSSIRRS